MSFYEHVLNDEVFSIVLSTCESATLAGLNDPLRFRQRARTIGSNIYDMTAVHSGLISKGCIIAMREGTQKTVTKEHFHGRQECGEVILNYVKAVLEAGAKIDHLAVKALVDKYRQVHYTSSEENTALAVLAKKDPELQKDWVKMYELCGIELVPYVRNQRYSKYSV